MRRGDGTDTAAPAEGTVSAAEATAAAAAGPATEAQTGLINQAGQWRFATVESLRAVAAVGVVVAHVYGTAHGTSFGDFKWRLILGLGFGALLFFALSGCLLYMPWARRDFGGGNDVSLRQYTINRAVRIFPLYYVALFATLLVVNEGGTLGQWVRWSLFLENFQPNTLYQVNAAMWTIVIELQFYLLLPFLAWAISRIARGSIKKAAWLIIGLGLASVIVRIVFYLAPAPPDKNLYIRFSLLSTFYFVAAGMLVALALVAWREHGKPRWLRGPLDSSDVWIVAAMPLWACFVYRFKLEPMLAPASFLVLGACVLPLEGSRRLVRILEWKWLAVLGLASYSLYVWHPALLRFSENHWDSFASNFWLLLVVAVPFCCAWALLSYRLVEAPALKLRKRWARKPADDRRPATGELGPKPAEATAGQIPA